MQFGGVKTTDTIKIGGKEYKRVKDLSKVTPLKSGFGGIVATDTMWVTKDSDDVISTLTDDEKFETGVKLGAGVAVGFTAVSLGFGVAAGIAGLIYQKVAGE